MGIKYKSNAASSLNANVTAIQTTLIPLIAGGSAKFPTITSGSGDYFYATLVNQAGSREVIKVTEHQASSDFFQVVERAKDGSTALAWSTGDKVQIRLPAVVMTDIDNTLTDHETRISTNTSGVYTNSVILELNKEILYAPTGTSLFFNNDTAPFGWTYQSGITDRVLAVKGGSNAYNVTGGTAAGSWTPTTHNHTMPSHAHLVNSHAHTVPQHTHTMNTHTHTMGTHVHSMPTHSHKYFDYDAGGASNIYASDGSVQELGTGGRQQPGNWVTHAFNGADYDSNEKDAWTAKVDPGDTNATDPGNTNPTDPGDTNVSAVSNTGNSSPATSSVDPGDTNSSSAPSTDRPYAQVGILASKDAP